MVKRKKYLLFPKLHLKHLLFLFFFIVVCMKKGVQIYFEQNQRIAIEFLKLYMYDIGDMFTIIPYLIVKKRIKNLINDKSENINDSNMEYIYRPEANPYDRPAFKNVFILTIVDFIAQISPVIYYVVKGEQKTDINLGKLNSVLIFNIFAIMVFSIFILHTKFYKHHLFAILIDIFCLIILTILDLKNIIGSGDNVTMPIIYIFVRIFSVILYSFENVLAKIIFLYNYMPTYTLLLNKSIFQFFYLVLFSFPFIFIKLDDKDGESRLIFSMIADIFKDKIYIYIVIVYTIISFFSNNLYLKIIDVFSPNHFVISRIFEFFGIFIIDLIVYGPDKEEYLIVKIILFILLIISAFIYNEFLVINICGLSKNTKLFLDYEAENEILLNKDIENEEQNIGVIEDTDDHDNN